jgi:hypothetical protein
MLCSREGSGIWDGLVQSLLANTGVLRKFELRLKEDFFFGITNKCLYPFKLFGIFKEVKQSYYRPGVAQRVPGS